MKLDFSDMLLVMRWFGLATFTAIAAYAIAVIPTLKLAFVLIALLPVSLYSRSVLSADGAALSAALVIAALCLRAARGSTAGRVWERSLWMTLCDLSRQPQIVLSAFGIDDLPNQAVAKAMASHFQRRPSVCDSVAAVGGPGISRSGELGACKKKDTTRPSISTRCGSFFICGNIHTIFLSQHGVHSALGGIGCGRNS